MVLIAGLLAIKGSNDFIDLFFRGHALNAFGGFLIFNATPAPVIKPRWLLSFNGSTHELVKP